MIQRLLAAVGISRPPIDVEIRADIRRDNIDELYHMRDGRPRSHYIQRPAGLPDHERNMLRRHRLVAQAADQK